jgi:hypothetical protein
MLLNIMVAAELPGNREAEGLANGEIKDRGRFRPSG